MKIKQIAILWGALLLGGTAMAADKSLMAYYPFDGNAKDASGNNNHGIPYGNLQLTADRKGKPNKAYLFDGVSGYIRVPNKPSLNPTGQMSIAFWMRVSEFSNNWSGIVSKGQPETNCGIGTEYQLWLNSDSHFELVSAGNFDCHNYINGPSVNLLNKWVFVVAVIDRRVSHTMRIYFNGVLNKEAPDTYSSFNVSNHALLIGKTEDLHPSYSPFKGALDDLRLYNRALTEAEIQRMYRLDYNVSGSVYGFNSLNVVCANKTTNKSVSFASTNTTASTWNCEQKGLVVNPGDQVTVTLSGKAHQ